MNKPNDNPQTDEQYLAEACAAHATRLNNLAAAEGVLRDLENAKMKFADAERSLKAARERVSLVAEALRTGKRHDLMMMGVGE